MACMPCQKQIFALRLFSCSVLVLPTKSTHFIHRKNDLYFIHCTMIRFSFHWNLRNAYADQTTLIFLVAFVSFGVFVLIISDNKKTSVQCSYIYPMVILLFITNVTSFYHRVTLFLLHFCWSV